MPPPARERLDAPRRLLLRARLPELGRPMLRVLRERDVPGRLERVLRFELRVG